MVAIVGSSEKIHRTAANLKAAQPNASRNRRQGFLSRAAPRHRHSNRRLQLHRQVRGPAPAGRGRRGEDSDPQPGAGRSVRRPGAGGSPGLLRPGRALPDDAGSRVLYNTYWIRFGRGRNTFDQAVENSRVLFDAAAKAGVGRIVHFSVANASSECRLPYFRGKGQVEEILQDMGIPFAIIRPTLVFGEGDLLLNNMAWALRRFPVFPVFGNGNYPVQPVYAEDLAALAVDAGSRGEALSLTPPGRRRSPLRNCCGCWPRRWAPASGWCILRRRWVSP